MQLIKKQQTTILYALKGQKYISVGQRPTKQRITFLTP